jgi:nucleotide-binding universal stress UspA family protein
MEDVMKLLVAIDSSPVSKTVVNEVARRPWPSGTTACVLHIVDWPQLPSSASLVQAIKESAIHFVKEASDKLGKAGLPATPKVLDGHPRIAVAEYAKEWGADLVLVGSHGASGLVRFLLGSVAQAALRRSPCSVEIVRRPAQDSATVSNAMKILIGTDGSDCSMAAVRSVAERPWPVGSQISVISVVPLIIPFGETMPFPVAPIYPPDFIDTAAKQARGRAEEAVARARQILNEARIKPVETEFQPLGDARQVILDEAKDWGADLIVVGSHGYRGVDRFMLGSVSESVAMHAHCSVEVIRESGFPGSKE